MAIRIFGLTGGIGSGKSTVARRFRERGLTVIDADVLAREVVEPGTPALADIVAEFGEDVLDERGALDRKKLAARVFGDETARRKLNSMTHPRVAELFRARAAELEARGEPVACYEVPLLVESGLAAMLRPVVVVAVPEAVQIARTVARDGATEEEARARIRAQMPLEEKVKAADHVIDNSGPLAETLSRADDVLDAVLAELGVKPSRYPKPS